MLKFDAVTKLPLEIDGGKWGKPAGHLQGTVVDDERRYMYMTFTDRLLKIDMQTGEIVGSVTGLLAGGIFGGGAHLGDLAFRDGKIYGSLEYKAAEKFYIAVFDAEKITALDMDYKTPGVMTTMYMAEVVRDYLEELGAGEHENVPGSMGHRYGCSGIDGITFGPMPGDQSGKIYMFVAYGVYRNVDRQDNDYQVILCFDPDDFAGEAFDQNNPHHTGPEVYKKLFVYTGNTTFGVQNLEYDLQSGDYWMIVYLGVKEQFNNRPVYIVDGSAAPQKQKLQLGDNPAYAGEEGEVLSLKPAGSYHVPTGLWGVDELPIKATTGFVSLGDDYFYVAESGKEEDLQYGKMHLMKLDRTTYTFRCVE